MHKKYFLSTAINTENTGLRGGSPVSRLHTADSRNRWHIKPQTLFNSLLAV